MSSLGQEFTEEKNRPGNSVQSFLEAVELCKRNNMITVFTHGI